MIPDFTLLVATSTPAEMSGAQKYFSTTRVQPVYCKSNDGEVALKATLENRVYDAALITGQPHILSSVQEHDVPYVALIAIPRGARMQPSAHFLAPPIDVQSASYTVESWREAHTYLQRLSSVESLRVFRGVRSLLIEGDATRALYRGQAVIDRKESRLDAKQRRLAHLEDQVRQLRDSIEQERADTSEYVQLKKEYERVRGQLRVTSAL